MPSLTATGPVPKPQPRSRQRASTVATMLGVELTVSGSDDPSPRIKAALQLTPTPLASEQARVFESQPGLRQPQKIGGHALAGCSIRRRLPGVGANQHRIAEHMTLGGSQDLDLGRSLR